VIDLTYQELFLDIYKTNFWRDAESRSGTGSNLAITRKLVEELPGLFRMLETTSILDVPCGDYYWMRTVPMHGIKYTGADLVPEIIADNRLKHPNVDFIELDMLTDKLPYADLVIVRDCLVHFPNDAVFRALNNVYESASKYFLSTTFPNHSNKIDIEMGDWRPLNLQDSPFNLPEPLAIINEGLIGDCSDKSMAVWSADQLKLGRNESY
jgi:SAM-dependent methyltransferase